MSDKTEEIARLEAIQDSGLEQVTSDGQTVKWNQDALAKRLRNLRTVDDTEANRRPVVATIKLT